MTYRWLTLMSASLCCWGPPESWDFGKTKLGALPADCTVYNTADTVAGNWRIVADEGNNVLAQTDRTKNSERITIAALNNTSCRNVKVSARIRVLGGDTEQSAGLVWRLTDADNYLLARLDVMDKRVRLYRVCHGNRIMFGMSPELTVAPREWHALRIEHKDEVIKVYLDDEIQFIRWDRHIQEAGNVGMWAKGDSLVQFDDFRLVRRDDDKECCIGQSTAADPHR